MASVYGPGYVDKYVSSVTPNNPNIIEKSGHIKNVLEDKILYQYEDIILFFWKGQYGPRFNVREIVSDCTTYLKKTNINKTQSSEKLEEIVISRGIDFLIEDFNNDPKLLEFRICFNLINNNANKFCFAYFVFFGSLDTGICYDIKVSIFPLN